MPVKLTLGNEYFKLEYSGVVKIDEMRAAYGELVGDNAFDHIRFGMVDCRNVESVEYSEFDYKTHGSLAAAAAKIGRRPEMPLGIVVPNDEVAEAVNKAISAARKFGLNWDRKIFRDYEEAFKWASGE